MECSRGLPHGLPLRLPQQQLGETSTRTGLWVKDSFIGIFKPASVDNLFVSFPPHKTQ